MNDVVVERDPSSEKLEAARQYALVIEWSPEDAAFVVSVPDIPEIHTHGATREEAAMAGDHVLALWLSARRRSGHTVPSPSFQARYGVRAINPTDDSERIREIRRRLDVSQRDFAEMLNVSVSTVRSWEQGLHTPDGTSLRLLDIAERQPEVLLNAPMPRQKRTA